MQQTTYFAIVAINTEAVRMANKTINKGTETSQKVEQISGLNYVSAISVTPSGRQVDRIFIPAAERGCSVKNSLFSVRLSNLLAAWNIRLLGELHGKNYTEFSRWPNCGKNTLSELREFVRRLQSSTIEPPSSPGNSPFGGVSPGQTPVHMPSLAIPLITPDLKLAELPMSVRLENVLKQCGYKLLGDLHGLETADLLKVRNCGQKSILELKELIRRAAMGEFSSTAREDVGLCLHEIIHAIDSGLASLSNRNHKIFDARLSLRTLEDVSLEFKMTRERVRQIVNVSVDKMRRDGGPRLREALKAVVRECQRRVCLLTPDLFVRWIGGPAIALSR
ncbi:MAG: hypothetical protein M3Y82_11855, partial [Verrucomicrobiota bacterium]|nr:hypothetical protein [Verrucomicrobiota bacterium]